ncbi:hypothetical protein Glove_692g37 [Diversispora epigaea]|uniref:SWIM-type domain-containing protein n=1 Tax=Diversispora epigaea TaxID=1348612 RepID=A0A397GAF0_9GLOM|nr:hypothetical protein Glove_692g37 [Diversispora epigaea]
MIQAMYKRTKIGCEVLIQQAIEECPVPTIKQYIKRYYLKNTRQWALWARQHSPLLLQVHVTKSLRLIKKGTDSEYVAFEFRTKKISVMGVDDEILNEFHKFPFPVQRMLADEACKAAPGITSLHCNCIFYHRNLNPCRHIFHEHMYGATKLLTADAWEKFQWMFEENGF